MGNNRRRVSTVLRTRIFVGIKTRVWQSDGVRQKSQFLYKLDFQLLLVGFVGLFLMTISVLLLWSFVDYWRSQTLCR